MLGIDLGARKVSMVDIDQMFSHHVEVPRSERGKELGEMFRLVSQFGLTGTVWVEAPVLAGARDIQATISVAQMSGVVHAALPEAHQVAVASWKKRTIGNGNADKDSVREWIDRVHPELTPLCRGNQDLYDAACIALYGRTVEEVLEASGLAPL
jgi:Holliday junction resolvasome RuvABC endonuclease subunit